MDSLSEEIEKYKDVGERLLAALSKYSSNDKETYNTAEVKINAGGLGVLLVTGFAAFMCGLCLAIMFIVFRQEKRIDNLNVIYQYAPQLNHKDAQNVSNYNYHPKTKTDK